MSSRSLGPAPDEQKPYAKEGYALMGAVFEVHRELGGGLLEAVYQETLEYELRLRQTVFEAKHELTTFYNGHALTKKYISDLLVHGGVIVELKSVSALAAEHEAQLLNYVRLTRKPVGYLINFGPMAKVEWKRFVLSEFCSSH